MPDSYRDAWAARWPATARWMLLAAMTFVAVFSLPWLLLGYGLLLHPNTPSENAAVGLAAVLAGASVGALLVAAVAVVVAVVDVRSFYAEVFIEDTDDGPILVGVRRSGRRVDEPLA